MMMRLLPRAMFFPLILFICCCFCFGKAIDCGGSHVANTIIVDQQGKGAFKTIQSAFDSLKSNNDRWIKIQINPGTYVEQVQIPLGKPCIILEGSGSNNTIVAYSDSQERSGLNISTFTSRTPNVVLSGITFENSFAYQLKGVALAAAIHGDKTVIFKCSFLGYQDTLFDAVGRYFKDCYIQGEIDFICGYVQSYYEDCVINATQFESRPSGFAIAQCRQSPDEPTGFVFRKRRLDGIGKVDLGRPWSPYSRVILWEAYLSSVVLPEG